MVLENQKLPQLDENNKHKRFSTNSVDLMGYYFEGWPSPTRKINFFRIYHAGKHPSEHNKSMVSGLD